ncbi:hypothetical protein, partial [Bordetella hinzii]|uniref:hypothetical protein n=1 Tax=Bordetella hinzii TaxID=103855 RepID=UPI001CA80382
MSRPRLACCALSALLAVVSADALAFRAIGMARGSLHGAGGFAHFQGGGMHEGGRFAGGGFEPGPRRLPDGGPGPHPGPG